MEALLRRAAMDEITTFRVPSGGGGDDHGQIGLGRHSHDSRLGASATAITSMAWRSWFRRSSPAASCPAERIFRQEQLRAERRVADAAARMMRPDEIAEMLHSGAPASPAASNRAERPTWRRLRMTVNPGRTKGTRPTSGTTSATVARATRSRLPMRSGSDPPLKKPRALRARLSATRKRKTTPAAQMAQLGQVLTVGVDDGERLRQLRRRLVVVEDDRVEPEPFGFGQGHDAGAAIDRDENVGALLLQTLDGIDVGAITSVIRSGMWMA